MTYFLPRECPKCERIVSPAAKPKAGDLTVCPLCDAMLVFTDELLLQPATGTARVAIQDWLDDQSAA